MLGPCTFSLHLRPRSRGMLQPLPPPLAENTQNFLTPPPPPQLEPQESKTSERLCPGALQRPQSLRSCEKEKSLVIRIFNIYFKSVEAEPAVASRNVEPGREPAPATPRSRPGGCPSSVSPGTRRGGCPRPCHPSGKKKGTPTEVSHPPPPTAGSRGRCGLPAFRLVAFGGLWLQQDEPVEEVGVRAGLGTRVRLPWGRSRGVGLCRGGRPGGQSGSGSSVGDGDTHRRSWRTRPCSGSR